MIFINDQPLYINTQVDLFAEDTTLIWSVDYKCIEELEDTLSREVSNVDDRATTINYR